MPSFAIATLIFSFLSATFKLSPYDRSVAAPVDLRTVETMAYELAHVLVSSAFHALYIIMLLCKYMYTDHLARQVRSYWALHWAGRSELAQYQRSACAREFTLQLHIAATSTILVLAFVSKIIDYLQYII